MNKGMLLVKFEYIVSLLVFYILINYINTTKSMIIISTILFIYVLLHQRIFLKSLKDVILSCYCFIIIVYFIYFIIPLITFYLDNEIPRINYFIINQYNVLSTAKLYYKIIIIFLVLSTFIGYPKKNKVNSNMLDNGIECKYEMVANFIAICCTMFFSFLFLRNGLGIFSQHIRSIRFLTSTTFNNYIYFFMIVYSYVNIINIYNNKTLTKSSVFVIAILLIFWLFSIFVDRRWFILLSIMVFLTIVFKSEKVTIKTILKVCIFATLVLFLGSIRERKKVSERSFNDNFYSSTAEFTLTNYVSVYYYSRLDNGYKLLNGKTYTYYVLTNFLPRKLYNDKPENLGLKFKQESNVNVGYAFNPVAEGIINFGRKAVFITPLVFIFYVLLASYFCRKNFLLYILMYGYCVNFIRGTFSIMIFDIVLISVIFIIFYKKKNGDTNEVFINNCNT